MQLVSVQNGEQDNNGEIVIFPHYYKKKINKEKIKMTIETKNAIYDVAINVAQIEITGRCNMGCLHCRGVASREDYKDKIDMPVWAIKKAIDFAKENSENNFLEIVLSGGEPLLHPNLEEILNYCEECGVHKEITTNGSLIDEKYIDMLKRYNITNMSVSIDSAEADKHDYMRQCPGAFKKATTAIEKMIKNDINTRIRATISKRNIGEMEEIAKLAISMGIKSFAVGPMIPVGNAVNLTNELFLNSEEMKQFIDRFFELKEKYKDKLDILTNECLHGLYYLENKKIKDTNSWELNGCTAGVVTFNVLLNGDITPCSMFHKKIANIYENENLAEEYSNNKIIHDLLDRNYKGKCGKCDKKYVCGGCRVRAEYFYNDYLEEDKLCWL